MSAVPLKEKELIAVEAEAFSRPDDQTLINETRREVEGAGDPAEIEEETPPEAEAEVTLARSGKATKGAGLIKKGAGVSATKKLAKSKPEQSAHMKNFNFFKDTPPELILELLVPYILNQMLGRVEELRKRRDEIEARLNELAKRQEEVSSLEQNKHEDDENQNQAEEEFTAA